MLLEVGAVGVGALLWLYVRSVGALGSRARREDGDLGWLLTALAAAITAFAVGMLVYDAFSFIQVTFVSFILLGLGCAALRMAPSRP
jgi:type III secretory pathway component EscR